MNEIVVAALSTTLWMPVLPPDTPWPFRMRGPALPVITAPPTAVEESVPPDVELAPFNAPRLRPCLSGVVLGLAPNERLAVRSGPGVEFPQINEFYPGQAVEVCARVGNWFLTPYGWASGQFVGVGE